MRSMKSQTVWCARAQVTTSLLMGVLIIGFFSAVWWPARLKQSRLREQIAVRSGKLETNQARAMNLPILAAEVAKLEAKLQRFNKKLPRTAELDGFVREMTQASQQCALRKLVHQPGAVKRLDLFSEIPISMNFEGDFNGVFAFLRQMEEMQRLTRVKSLTVKTRDPKLGTVDVNMAMNIYYSEF